MRNRSGVLLLLTIVLASGIAVIYIRHQHRLTFMALQETRQYRDDLNIEWRKLILEESTWSVHDLVERNARRKLGMTVPKPDEVLVLSVQQ